MAHTARGICGRFCCPHRSSLEDFSAAGNRYAGGSRFGGIGCKLMVEKKKAYGPGKEKNK